MNIKIIISSNINFYKKTLPIILLSLYQAGYNKSDILVFIGGYLKNNEFMFDGVQCYELNNNTFDLTALIGVVEYDLHADFWILLHDTCKVGQQFKELIEAPLLNNDIIKIAVRPLPSMSMGAYSGKYLLDNKDRILSIKNTDYSDSGLKSCKQWHIDNEDFILHRTEPHALIYPNCFGFHIIEPDDWYGSESRRRTEYYPHVDLYKNKSNWGQLNPDQVIINL